MRKPCWLSRSGCVLGIGAVRGANLLRGKWRSVGATATGFADIVTSFSERVPCAVAARNDLGGDGAHP